MRGLNPPVSGAPSDVVGDVAVPARCLAGVLQEAVGGLGGAVRCAGLIEECQDVIEVMFRRLS